MLDTSLENARLSVVACSRQNKRSPSIDSITLQVHSFVSKQCIFLVHLTEWLVVWLKLQSIPFPELLTKQVTGSAWQITKYPTKNLQCSYALSLMFIDLPGCHFSFSCEQTKTDMAFDNVLRLCYPRMLMQQDTAPIALSVYLCVYLLSLKCCCNTSPTPALSTRRRRPLWTWLVSLEDSGWVKRRLWEGHFICREFEIILINNQQ